MTVTRPGRVQNPVGLDRPAAKEMEEQGDNRKHQNDVDEAAGDMEGRKAEKPQNEENRGNDR